MANEKIAGFIVPWTSDLIRRAEKKAREKEKDENVSGLRTLIFSFGVRCELNRIRNRWSSDVCSFLFIPSFFRRSAFWFRRV